MSRYLCLIDKIGLFERSLFCSCQKLLMFNDLLRIV